MDTYTAEFRAIQRGGYPEDLGERVLGARAYSAAEVAEGIAEAEAHGHPEWSHVLAFGPCTLGGAS